MRMRKLALALGSLVLAAAWLVPWTAVLPGPFTAHMTMHMAVVAVAAPLIALGLAGSRGDPVRRLPALFAPIPLSMLELVVVWAWHAPALHHFARSSALGVALEQTSFLACGTAVWLSALGGPREERRDRAALGLVALLLTSMHVTLLGALLALPQRVLYAHGAHHHRSGALTPLQDQHLGGAIMLIVGGVVYLAGGVALGFELMRARRQRVASAAPIGSRVGVEP
jgi:putative membrane protein